MPRSPKSSTHYINANNLLSFEAVVWLKLIEYNFPYIYLYFTLWKNSVDPDQPAYPYHLNKIYTVLYLLLKANSVDLDHI
jgi:hypothetical protein